VSRTGSEGLESLPHAWRTRWRSGKRNGNYRSGAYSYETQEAVAFLRAMARLVRKMDIP
jgi:hypothetical protein